jgi:hypothetical protein
MDINLTAVERNVRYYGPPAIPLIACFVVAMLTYPEAPASGVAGVLAQVWLWLHLGAVVGAMFSSIWLGYRAWIDWRWERGEYDGGCIQCGGPMRHLHGRYGAYSKCQMCGEKREGWH